MLLKFVPAAVLNSGTLVRDAQLLNMLVKSAHVPWVIDSTLRNE
jgi:hypothetical protein